MTVDTGSNITIVQGDVLLLPGEEVATQPVESLLHTVTRETAPIQGKCSVPLTIGTYQTTQETLITDIADECIISLNFLQQHNGQVDLRYRVLHIGCEEILLRRPQIQQPVCCQCYAKGSVTIPPFSEMIVPAQVNGDLTNCRWVPIEQENVSLSHIGVLVKTLVDVQQEEVPVRMLNLTQYPQQIRRGTPLATCEPMFSIHPGQLE